MATKGGAISIIPGQREGSPEETRRSILSRAIQNVVSALGGFEQISPTETVYVLGDSCLGCLKDLKKLWRKDDTDDERTVARIFYECRVLHNDLIPILLETAGKGKVDDRCALACADLITAMTWPIDIAEELKELDDGDDAPTDYTSLLEAHRSYKAAILKPGVIGAVFSIMLPPLAKGKKDRTERDGQIINLVLHCFRNLAFIKDPPPKAHASGEQAEYATLQSKLINTLQQSLVLDTLLSFASNADDPMFNPWNNLLLEIFYLLFRGVNPVSLTLNQRQKTKEDLKNLLDVEAKSKREDRKHSSSRHSRFGTTITVKSGNEQFIMHSQQALTADTTSVMDMAKKKVTKRVKKLDELGGNSFLNVDALISLQTFAKGFITNCFNRFLSSLLKDIRAERAKITEKDNLRLLFVAKWFLEFFLHIREKEGEATWRFTFVSEVVDETWVPWVLRRMREAQDDKPKQWTELRAGVDCLTQLLLLIECMSSSKDDAFAEVSQALQHKLYYNGEILDLAFETLKSYKEGSQSIAYLDSTIHLGYVLLRVLEKWAKTRGEMVVRRKKKAKNKKKKAKGVTEEEGIVDVASEEEMEEVNEEHEYRESMTTFEVYEARFANPDVTNTCLFYLSRYKEYDSPERMKRVVGLLHRQAVKVKAEGLFFQVTTLELFYRILKEEKMFPRDQPHLDLIQLIKFILRKFFKAVGEDTFTLVEAFFPTGRGRWKQKSSFVPPKKIAKGGLSDSDDDVSYDEDGNPRTKSKAKESKHGPDVYVKKGYSWSEQLGIAIACLIEDDKMALVDWVKEILIFVIGSRQRIVDETDDFWGDKNKDDDDDPDADPDEILRKRAQKMIPSADAARKFEDYVIPYETQDKADAATKNQHLKLVFRLVKFFVTEEDADELEWYVPAAVIPDELQRSLNVIEQFIKEPLDLKGKKAKEMLGKKRAAGGRARGGRRRRRRGALGSGDEEGLSAIDLDDVDDDDEPRKKRKKKEKEIYKSAQFIQDSDAELGDDDEFFEKERALREKTALAAVEGGGTMGGGSNMAPTGTKKRKKKTKEVVAKKFKTWKAGDDGDAVSGRDRSEEVDDNDSDADEDAPPPVPKPRPKPRRLRASSPGMLSNATSAAEETDPGTMNDGNSSPTRLSPPTAPRPRPKPRRRFGGGSTAADGDPLTSSPSRAASVAEDDEDDDISRDSVPAKGPTPDGDSTNEVSFGAQEEDDDEPVVNLTQRRRKPIVIASDEEE